MDQLLNMRALEAIGAGCCMRAARLSAAKFSDVVYRMLNQESFSTAARNFSQLLVHYDALARMKNIAAEVLS